jgi:ABC-2 type transport system ATP-binding protein
MIEIKGMAFGYKRQPLFEGLDHFLEPGNIYGLLGKNGAGKTTLLKLICGMRFPQAGECRVLGYPPQNRPAGMLEDICLIGEELFVPPVTPLFFERLYAPFYPRFDHGVFVEHLREFDLDASKRLTELSYGQKKKFLIAFGLACRTRLLLLDEPTNGLDIPSKSQFRKALARSTTGEQLVLISTHQVRDMENLIDPIIILDEGKVIFQESMAEASRRLSVSVESDEPADAGVVFSDKTMGGYLVVRENTAAAEHRVDLETLFNTVIANRERIRAIFGGSAAGKGA